MSTLNCSIVTPEKKVFDGKINYISAPGKIGEFGVLPGHENFITTLDIGIINIENENNETEQLLVVGGYFEVSEDKVIVIADEVYYKDDVDVEKVTKKLEEYKAQLSSLGFNDADYPKVKHKYEKYSNMLKLAS